MSYDMFLPLVSIIVHAFYFGTPENEWRELFWRYLPDWLTINDPRVLRAFYLGDAPFFETHSVKKWVITDVLVVRLHFCADFRDAVYQCHHPQTVDGAGTPRVPDC